MERQHCCDPVARHIGKEVLQRVQNMPATGEADLALSKDAASGKEAPLIAKQTAGPKLADKKKLAPEESPSMKRKDVDSSTSHRFKVVSQLVIAMKRFQGAYDPSICGSEQPALPKVD